MRKPKQKKPNGTHPSTETITVESPVRKLYAEYFDEMLQQHRETCKAPICNESQVVHFYKGLRVTPMVRTGSPKEVFLTINSQPIQAIQLLTGDEIKAYFNEDGTAAIDCHRHEKTDRAYIYQRCHVGAGVGIVPSSGGKVHLVCADKSDGTLCGKTVLDLDVAPQPKAKYPNIFCSHHGVEPSYVVCPHVLSGTKATRLLPPTEKDCGEACCEPCNKLYEAGKFKDLNFHAACQSHVNQLLGNKPNKMLKAA
jgi:hypothetical protein